ncbi:hypothetical protein T4E_11690 [Trichinella pseudospiralis]|uniref:Uncharacterized protein n=1 Tax=Trichinella pseudospiralis TaxID=6337 RepID=A0A0V0Y120_TRIPS|nr:hypothetical protein T4E_11690 [Trichinella pseudospiralis]
MRAINGIVPATVNPLSPSSANTCRGRLVHFLLIFFSTLKCRRLNTFVNSIILNAVLADAVDFHRLDSTNNDA